MSNIYILNDMKFEGVINIPLLKIEYIKSDIDLSVYDYLIFTSKNAIYAIDSFNKNWKNIPSLAIAPKTSEIISKYGGKVELCGNSSNGDDFAKEIIKKFTNKKVLYIRAKKVVSNLTTILKDNNIETDELIAYQTTCNNNDKKIILDKNAIIIFSSPSTINCFFKHYKWENSYTAIAIGETTSSYLPKDINIIISPTQSIEKCIELAKNNVKLV